MQLPPGITEQELIRQCKNGDIKKLELLYKHFYGYAMGVSLRYSHTRDDALEVVNDAFIKVFGELKKYDDDKPFKPWLRKVVVNTAIDKQRKNNKHNWHADLEQAEAIAHKATVIDQLNARDILILMNCLPQVQRMVFNLYEIDGYTHDEIGQMLDITASSSRVYLARAKEKLRKAMSEEEKQL